MMTRMSPTETLRTPSRIERILCSLGVNAILAEQVFGDLAETFHERAARDGLRSARWWYAREVLRSAPHLGWSALRDGGPRERAQLGACVAGLAVLVSLIIAAVNSTRREPARLKAGSGTASEPIVINNMAPTQLPMSVLDAKGRPLGTSGVQYEWKLGIPLPVSPRGVVTCAHAGDAVVRATVKDIATDILVR